MKLVIMLLFACFVQTAGAQNLKAILERKKAEAKAKVDYKADVKSSEGIDSAIAAPGTAVRKIKQKKTEKKNEAKGEVQTPETPQPGQQQYSQEPEGSLVVIETNILCEEGKKKMETKLRKQPAVLDVQIDHSTGDLSIRFKPTQLTYTTIVEMINNAGFSADGKQPASAAPANPCATP